MTSALKNQPCCNVERVLFFFVRVNIYLVYYYVMEVESLFFF